MRPQLPERTSIVGHKRPLPVEDEGSNEYDTLSVHADTYGFVEQPNDHSNLDEDALTGNLPEVAFFVVRGTRQSASKTDNMSDLFPAKSAESIHESKTQVLDVT